MTNIVSPAAGTISKAPERRDIGIKRRYAAERRFRAYGVAAISFGLIFLQSCWTTVIRNGYTAFQQTAITLPVEFTEKTIDPDNKRATDPSVLIAANYGALLRDAIVKELNINRSSRPDVRDATAMLSKACADPTARHGRCRSVAHRHRPSTSPFWPMPMWIAPTRARSISPSMEEPQGERQASRLDERADGERRAFQGVQYRPFHQRQLQPTGSCRSRRGSGRLALPDADRSGSFTADRRGRLDLSRGIRAEEQADRSDRGQHQQSRGRSVDRLTVCLVLRSSSTSPACRVRLRWSAAWC